MLRQMSIVMIVAGLSMVLVGSTWGQDHWGTYTEGEVKEVTVLNPDETEYDDSVKEPELTFDGSRLYFNNAAGETEGGMQLFMADANDGDYGLKFLIDGDAMENVNSDAHDMSPCVNSDESLLFFTSKRTLNNQTTFNIWLSTDSGGEWQTPIALPGDVNDCPATGCYNEIGPNFVDEDDWLYFASNRPYDDHTEQGRYRLWISIWNGLATEFQVDEDTTYHVLELINVEGINQYAPELTYTGDSLYFTYHDPDIENDATKTLIPEKLAWTKMPLMKLKKSMISILLVMISSRVHQ